MTAAAPASPPPLVRGVVTLSFDLELAWGEFYRRPVDVERLLAARRALPRLLALLARHRLGATFAVVGHLLLEGCDGHPELPRPTLAWRRGDWLDQDPRGDEQSHPAWYGAALVRAIAASAPGHDLGGHGFSHLPLDDPGVDATTAGAELAACARLLPRGGGPGLSFVYPRNGIGYPELLPGHGFACYRGAERRWYVGRPRPLRKAAHMLDQALALTPPMGLPGRAARGLAVEVPSSMLFLSREGFRRRIPMAARVARAGRGLAAAAARRRVFHLWMHVEDLVPDTEAMLAGLDAVLGRARAAIERGELELRTMADHATAAVPAGGRR